MKKDFLFWIGLSLLWVQGLELQARFVEQTECFSKVKGLNETPPALPATTEKYYPEQTEQKTNPTSILEEVNYLVTLPAVGHRVNFEPEQIARMLSPTDHECIPLFEGGQAQVYRYTADDGTSSILKIQLPQSESIYPALLPREFATYRALHRTKHPGKNFILKALGIYTPDGRHFSSKDPILKNLGTHTKNPTGHFALELEEGGITLYFFLRNPYQKPSGKRILEISQMLLQGIEAIHSIGLVHLDIKPGNVFISHDGTLKIGDFGVSVAEGEYPLYGFTPDYASPNLLKVREEKALFSDDYFATGVMLEEMILHWSTGKGLAQLPEQTRNKLLLGRISNHPVYVNSLPIYSIYKKMKATSPSSVSRLDESEERLLKMLSTIGWAKDHYKKPTKVEPSSLNKLLRMASSLNLQKNSSVAQFYKLYQKEILDEMDIGTVARFIFSDPGCIEAWTNGVFNFSKQKQEEIIAAAKEIKSEPSPKDIFPHHRATPLILDMEILGP